MIYELEGGNTKQQNIVVEAMSFVDPYLNLPDSVFIEVVLMPCSSSGCIDLEIDEEGDHNFLVEINNKQSLQDIVATVFHELKHVEQTFNKRLDQMMWNGVDYTGTSYIDRPWEKEAYGFEEETCKQWSNR